MIFMPGIVCQGDKRLTWAKYAVDYTEKAGSSATVTRNYARTKKAASAYTIQNGTFKLTNSATKTIENLAVGDYLVNVSTSNNTSTSGSTLYKVTSNPGRKYVEKSTSLSPLPTGAVKGVKTCKFDSETGKHTLSGTGQTMSVTSGGAWSLHSPYKDFSKAAIGTFDVVYFVGVAGESVYGSVKSSELATDVTINYTPYTLTGNKGEYIGEVKANEGTYPDNGIKDGFWYVLLN